jgi:nucleotide-binding universal stress UspA family protein
MARCCMRGCFIGVVDANRLVDLAQYVVRALRRSYVCLTRTHSLNKRSGGFMFKHILLPTDGSELSLKAVKLGVDVAKACGSDVLALHVVPPAQTIAYVAEMMASLEFDYAKEATRYAERYLADARAIADKAGVKFDRQLVFGAQPFQAILQTAKERHCDLIVMAAHSWEGLAKILMGSETHKVILKSDVPILVCH